MRGESLSLREGEPNGSDALFLWQKFLQLKAKESRSIALRAVYDIVPEGEKQDCAGITHQISTFCENLNIPYQPCQIL